MTIPTGLALLLLTAAGAQLIIAVANLFLERLLDWKEELDRIPLLMREVVRVHAWFISYTVGFFGVVTARFTQDLATGDNPVLTWFAAGVAGFWGIRTVLQVVYYSPTHWRGRRGRTWIHIVLIATYGGFTAVYGIAFLRGLGS